MRIRDWSSDVCSSDLVAFIIDALPAAFIIREFGDVGAGYERLAADAAEHGDADGAVGRYVPRRIPQVVPHRAGQRIVGGRVVEADMGLVAPLLVNKARLAHFAASRCGASRPLSASSRRISPPCSSRARKSTRPTSRH